MTNIAAPNPIHPPRDQEATSAATASAAGSPIQPDPRIARHPRCHPVPSATRQASTALAAVTPTSNAPAIPMNPA